MRVAFILPTYNERKNIGLLLEALLKISKKHKQYDFKTLVVDDNSPDGTGKIVREYIKKNPSIHLITGSKKGLGIAYVRGMKYAVEKFKADIFFEMDADLSHDPKLIPLFLAKIEDGADLVIGSRYIKGGSIPKNWAFHRKIFSIFGNLIVRFGLMIPKVREWSSGYRAIKSGVFKKVSKGLKQYPGYTFQIAFLHRAIQSGFNVVEIPLNFIDRRYGKSKFIPIDYISNVLLYIFLNSSFIRFCIVGGIGFIINIIGLEVFYSLGLRPGSAAALGAEFSIISNFFLNNFWAFSHKKIKREANLFKKFLQFNTVSIGAIIIQLIVVGLGTSIFGDQTRFIFLVLAIVVFIIPYSYFMYNKFIWKTKDKLKTKNEK